MSGHQYENSVLSPRDSAIFIVKNAKHVHPVEDGIKKIADIVRIFFYFEIVVFDKF